MHALANTCTHDLHTLQLSSPKAASLIALHFTYMNELDDPYLCWVWACMIEAVHGITGCDQKVLLIETWFTALVAIFKHPEGKIRYSFPHSRHYNTTWISLWLLDIQIWRFLWWQTSKQMDKTDCFTPCACVRDNWPEWKDNNIFMCTSVW